MANTVGVWNEALTGSETAWSAGTAPTNYTNKNGFDLIWRQKELQDQMAAVEDDIREIEANANLSDTEKMFSMQMAMNTWSAISNLRTNMLKTVADTLKSIARNVA